VFDWLREHTKLTVQLQQFVVKAPYPYFAVVSEHFLRKSMSDLIIRPQQKRALRFWRDEPHSPEEHIPVNYIVSIPRNALLHLRLSHPERIACWSEDLE
jgi:hypothetical protein